MNDRIQRLPAMEDPAGCRPSPSAGTTGPSGRGASAWRWGMVFLAVLLGGTALLIAVISEGHAPLARSLWAAFRWGAAFVLLFLFWTFFFAQFLLPLQRLEQRLQMAYRVLLHRLGLAGPVLQVQDGRILTTPEETLCAKGPGLVVTDLASAVVLRNWRNFTQVIPPASVGFFAPAGEEYVADVLDLRAITRTAGPLGDEDPFAPRRPEEDEQAYQERRWRYYQTRGVTRDGIEVVPRIWLLFHLNGEPQPNPSADAETGPSGVAALDRCLRQRLALAADPWRGRFPPFRTLYYGSAEAAWRAVRARPVDVTYASQAPAGDLGDQERHLPWDWFPAAMASDVWRDYVGRFTLEELFTPLPQHDGKTGLQVIVATMQARLTQPRFRDLDAMGHLAQTQWSQEYIQLQEHGIRVVQVALTRLHLPPEVEQRRIQIQTDAWLQRVEAEREVVERLRARQQTLGEFLALRDLSRQLVAPLAEGRLDGCLPPEGEQAAAPAPPLQSPSLRAAEALLQRVVAWVERPELRQRLGTPVIEHLRRLLSLIREHLP